MPRQAHILEMDHKGRKSADGKRIERPVQGYIKVSRLEICNNKKTALADVPLIDR